MVSAAYLMGSTGIRFKDSRGIELKWLPVIPKVKGRMRPSDIRIRAEAVFKQVPVRITNLVIVNSNLSTFEMIQTVVEVADKYADNVMVIPPLLARLSFALEQLASPIAEKIPKDETILVVTIVKEFSDFIILQRDQSFELYIVSHKIYKREECDEQFAQHYDDYNPHSTVILVHQDYHDLARDIRPKHRTKRSFLKVFKRWDFMLFFGGLFRSIINEKEYDQRYQLPNFTNGFEASIHRKNGPNKRHVLLEPRSNVPADMQGYDGMPQNIKILYCTEFNQVFEDLIWESKYATEELVKASGSSRQALGYVDERGVPYATPRSNAIIKDAKKEPPKALIKNESPKPVLTINMELVIDFLTGNMCEYNPSTKTKSIEESAFDPLELTNSTKHLTDILREKLISALHVITDKKIPKKYNDLFSKWCNNTSYIPHVKAQISYCFKKIKSEENIEKFAIILLPKNRLIDFCLFEYRNSQYFFIQRVQDVTAKEAEKKIKAEHVKDVFIFRPKGVQLSLNASNADVTVNVFEVRDYDNMALHGVFDMEENLKDLANNKDLKELFSLVQSGDCASPATSDICTFSHTSSPVNGYQNKESSSIPQVEVIFHKESFAIDICQNGAANRIKNAHGNYWTPMYLSMAQAVPEIGEKAKNDYQNFPKHVIYDVLKIIGKPLNEIKIDPRWGFKLVENNKVVHFQVETQSGPRLIPQELAISAFLKAMKIRAESKLETHIKEIRLSTSFKLTESQETIIAKAALKNKLEIVSFNVTDI